ncbi:MAG: thiamine-phosphate diphosphorylase [Euryarchaeota archaeon RBG_16_68_13]|nr:MAG: thiamine-phosphate diphosphorylase [Euryarchaeota archaeon RBG_16_68_13]
MPRLLEIVEAALQGGVSLVQFREKSEHGPTERQDAATRMRDLCREHHVPFIVNDDPLLAQALDADGVHVGRDDPSPQAAREILGPGRIVGVTVYGGPDEEAAAAAAGADYVAVGPFFPSPTKPEEPVLSLDVLDHIVERSSLPVFAIGGIHSENAGLLAIHGAAGIAVVSAIMEADDRRAAASTLARAFEAGALARR